ncbi:MAG: metallopeptidase TldD-related protein [Defluviitaleaceae bacterium]|nr:metallopeptidase TldD-related protein [Defluviitaleaceae bacterium]
MLDLLLSTLKTFKDVEYLIRETKTRQIENYNIKKQSEMSREIETILISLTLYVVFSEKNESGEDIKYRGSYNIDIHPGTTAEEIKNIITQGIYAAGFVKNAYFPLVSPTPVIPAKNNDANMEKALADLQAALFASDNQVQGHLSYSEFFVTQNNVRIINSNGVDVNYTTHSAFIETAVHYPTPGGGEIEISEAFRFSLDSTAADMLKNRIANLFITAAKKAEAKPTPAVGDINILLSGECLSTFFSYYHSCANAQLVYQQLSTFKENTEVQGSSTSDRISMILDPGMKGSSHSLPYDDHGQPLQSHEIIKDGKLLKYWGDTRFASYLGIEPTGRITNINVTGGTATTDDLRKEPYLELVSFSDFQADSITGDFGSEIRLGFYFDGRTIIPVTGGSISGNIANVHKGLRMSQSLTQYNNYRGPATICIKGVTISGAAS